MSIYELLFTLFYLIPSLYLIVIGIAMKLTKKSKIFNNLSDSSVGEILLFLAFLPTILLLFIIDKTPDVLSWKPFQKRQK